MLTGSPSWELSLTGDDFRCVIDGRIFEGSILQLDGATEKTGLIWSCLTLPLLGNDARSLDGIPNSLAAELLQMVRSEVHRVKIRELISNFSVHIDPVVTWSKDVREACKLQLQSKGWLTHEFISRWDACKPRDLSELLAVPEVARHLADQDAETQDAVHLWQTDFVQVANAMNEKFLAYELENSRTFLNQVEKSPLTEEQAQAVICFDNRVLLVASAGSGKTSTMVAKAGYALKKGYFAPEKILMLAFNADAADLLRERIKTRLGPMGLRYEQVQAKTFHAFGLAVIGEATGKKPSLAPWLENGRDLEILLALVDDLKDRDAAFKMKWDMFRVVLGQDLPKFGKEQESPDAWDRDRKSSGFWTLNGEVVKSRGEQVLANWLFYNGVKYQYETIYSFDTADEKHRQYRPDFYFPDIDVYLEHWAVDANGEPPPEFEGYKEGMAWKRQLHAKNETTLLETTMAQLWSGQAFVYLTEELQRLGITLDPNPDREGAGRRPIENPRLARTFRTFLTHAKSNQLTVSGLRQRLDSGLAGHFHYRHQVFLELFEDVWRAWEQRLKDDKCIDFEDMLNIAADCIESGKWKSPYELVMVDEFQDVSYARARLIAELIKEPDRHLFAVGDDWQSINRFAGSDLSVMTDFELKFGKAMTLKLEKTFRCPQSLCDISSSFVQRNPKQIRKKVVSTRRNVAQPVKIIRVEEDAKIRSAISKRLEELAADAGNSPEPMTVYVLGRYNRERECLPDRVPRQIQLKFVTVHSSKGEEADHVIIPRMTSETLGFPSRIEDDPVLQLAMPSEDVFEDAEERRLFYVALTRARSTVTLVTVAHKESVFVTELVKEHNISVHDIDGVVESANLCPVCGQGFMIQRNGPYGPFLGCSRFPKCNHKAKVQTP